jgi:hypothetical protein
MVSGGLQVLVEPTLPSVVPYAIAFETGAGLVEIRPDPDRFVYEHHGEGFTPEHPGALTQFYEDVSLGRTLPVTFATHSIRDVDTVVALALFMNRDLVLIPAMVGLVAQIDLIHRRPVMLAHLDPHMVCFIRMLRTFFPQSVRRSEMASRIEQAASWIRDYVTEGTFPALGRSLPEVTVLDKGTGGFVVAETAGDLLEGWTVLFSLGHVRGVLVGPERDGRRQVMTARKSAYVALNLTLAAKLLNDVETAMGEPPEWTCHGDMLVSPPKGTLLTVPLMLEVFLRV